MWAASIPPRLHSDWQHTCSAEVVSASAPAVSGGVAVVSFVVSRSCGSFCDGGVSTDPIDAGPARVE
eukprot:4550946-Prymnesium_polylepis.1